MNRSEYYTRREIIEEAETWEGTPFHHGAGVKGVGCDCAHLVSGVLEDMNLIPKVNYPVYGPDWFRHADHEEKFIVETLRALGLPQVEQPQMGDIAVIKFGRAYSHCVFICGDGYGIQAWPTHSAVSRVKLAEERLWKRSVKMYFSLIKG